MTFGRTLQELTRLCGVKRCNLADALGYDPSYISRWINGVKHPSLRSNDALPAQIAAYLTANAAPDVRARIAGQFDLRCDAADDAGFSAALASLLADTIAADRAVDPARPQPTGAENAANEENASCSRFAQTSGCVWRMYTPNEAVEKNEMNLHTALFCTLIRMKKANSATEDSTMNTEV